MAKKITMGLDLSLVGTGLVVLKDGKMIDQKLIKSKSHGDTPTDEIERLLSIVREIDNYVSKYEPELVAIEGLAFGIIKTVSIMQLAGLSYLVRELLLTYGIQFVLIAPSSLKKFATGKGIGPKDVMMLEIYKRWGISFSNNNVADGFALSQVAHELINDNKIPSFQTEVLSLLRKQIK